MSTPDLLNAICRQSFDSFAEKVFHIVEPGQSYEWNWHVGCIAEHLEYMHKHDDMQRLIINLPPRCLKSYLVSVAWPAWLLGHDATQKFIMTSYGQAVALDQVEKCRTIIKDDWYKECFKETIIDPTQDSKDYWRTTKRGFYYAAGILGAITGKGADWVLADDLLKPDEALSDQVRNATNQRVRNTLFSRFNDARTGKFVMIMQRLHDDDPTGNLLKDEGYTLLKLPAEAKTSVHIRLGDKVWDMQEGQLLFPERLTHKVLADRRLDLGEYNYAGQYLQEPVPLGGGLLRPEWLLHYAQGGIKPRTMNIYILVDPAGGDEMNKRKKKNSDWTAMMVVGLGVDNNYYILDVIRDRLNPTERIDTLFMLHRKWNGLAGKPPKVGYEKYGMMTDTHYLREKQRTDAYNFPIVELGGSQMKEQRIMRLEPDLRMGRWYAPQSLLYVDGEGRSFDLINELQNSEMTTFPRARHDDMLDALSRIYEDELNATFPRVKVKSLGYSEPREQHWTDL